MLTQAMIDQARRSDLLALAGVTLRKVAGTGRGEYAGPCPICGGHDRFRVQPSGPDGPRWYCRQCGGGKWHDAIDLVRQLKQVDFAEAVTMLIGSAPDLASAPRPAAPAEAELTAAPGQTWQAAARRFCDDSLARLWSDAGRAALDGLRARGLADETIRAAGLGWHELDRYEERAAWGLPEEQDDRDRPRRVWLPRGVVIPWQIGGQLWRVNIRRPAEDLARGGPKYIGPAGMGNGLYNADALRAGFPAVLVEGEIDALTIAQHGAGLAVAVATGSTHGARRTRWLARLALASSVLVCYDADEPGQAAADYWLDALTNARRWRPYWQDANAMAQDGADLRHWLAVGLGLASAPELAGSAQQTSLFDGAAPSPDAGPLVPHVANQVAQDGASAPDLAQPDSRLITGSARRPLVARPALARTQDPHAVRLVLADFERARQRLAELETEIDAGAARLAHLPQADWPAELLTRCNALAREALVLAPVAEYDSLAELETATGAAYQAVVSAPTDAGALERYRRLDDAWAAVLGLPELPHEVPA